MNTEGQLGTTRLKEAFPASDFRPANLHSYLITNAVLGLAGSTSANGMYFHMRSLGSPMPVLPGSQATSFLGATFPLQRPIR